MQSQVIRPSSGRLAIETDLAVHEDAAHAGGSKDRSVDSDYDDKESVKASLSDSDSERPEHWCSQDEEEATMLKDAEAAAMLAKLE